MPVYADNYQGIIDALIDKFGLSPSPMYGPPYPDSFKGIIQAIQDLDGSGGGGSGVGGLTWSIISSDTNAQSFYGYAANSGSRLLITLPSSPTIGDLVGFYALGTGGFRIVQNTGQQIQFGNQVTEMSTGYIESTEQGDSIQLTYFGGGLWGVFPGSQGNFNVLSIGPFPSLDFTNPANSMYLALGVGGGGRPNAGTGTNSLDFSDSENSMYLGVF